MVNSADNKNNAKTQPMTDAKDKKGGKPGSDRDVGTALRRAYEDTVGEAVPDSMLDLLKKLS